MDKPNITLSELQLLATDRIEYHEYRQMITSKRDQKIPWLQATQLAEETYPSTSTSKSIVSSGGRVGPFDYTCMHHLDK